MEKKNSLEQAVTGRVESLFVDDLGNNNESLYEKIKSSRILVIGGAGSIGSSLVTVLLGYCPKALWIVDPSENNLVEVVRDIRSSGVKVCSDFGTVAINFGTSEFTAFYRASKPFDYVLNFAAMKHVRSERDPYSLMRMIKINVEANQHLLELLDSNVTKKVFSVSSDKAVNPHSCMGASKTFMERVFLARENKEISFSSARFANVTFSDGSLLSGFRHRLDKRQPLSAPSDIRRYFITHQEAGELCLLSCFNGDDNEIYVPRMNPDEALMTFSEIAEMVLSERSLKPKYFDDEEEARNFACNMSPLSNEWPCIFSPSNTSGEKPFEEFIAANEIVNEDKYDQIRVISQKYEVPQDNVRSSLNKIDMLYNGEIWSKKDIVELLQSVVPEFVHEELEYNLDQKM